jgi:predicted transcriptional regulator
MDKRVSFRIDTRKLKVLDVLCSRQDRSRRDLLNEAVDNYLALQQHQRQLIEKGIRQADAGELVNHGAVERMIAGLRRG